MSCLACFITYQKFYFWRSRNQGFLIPMCDMCIHIYKLFGLFGYSHYLSLRKEIYLLQMYRNIAHRILKKVAPLNVCRVREFEDIRLSLQPASCLLYTLSRLSQGLFLLPLRIPAGHKCFYGVFPQPCL